MTEIIYLLTGVLAALWRQIVSTNMCDLTQWYMTVNGSGDVAACVAAMAWRNIKAWRNVAAAQHLSA